MARKSDDSITAAEYVLAACSFLPFIGVFMALGAIILGSIKFKTGGFRLILLGLGGILCSLSLGYMAYRHTFKKSFPASITREVALDSLKQCIMAIEYYKLVHGVYPAKLDDLAGNRRNTYIYDFSAGNFPGTSLRLSQYELQPDGQSYTLFDVGADGISGTADDIYPEILAEEVGHIGYVKK